MTKVLSITSIFNLPHCSLTDNQLIRMLKLQSLGADFWQEGPAWLMLLLLLLVAFLANKRQLKEIRPTASFTAN